jgi:hypothetical protein
MDPLLAPPDFVQFGEPLDGEGRTNRQSVLACEREPSDLLVAMIQEFGRIEPYFRE